MTFLRALLIFFVTLTVASHAGEIVVHWDGSIVSFGELQSIPDDEIRGPLTEAKLAENKVVPCAFDHRQTECYQLSAKAEDVYGWNMAFVRPIAAFPFDWLATYDDTGESEEPDYFDDAVVADLPEYTTSTLFNTTQEELLNGWNFVSSLTEDTTYSMVDRTIGGPEVLARWHGLIGKKPTRECRTAEEYCAIVLEAELKGRPAIAFCEIVNTTIGLGIPFNCDLVAFEGKAGWYVQSYNGPGLCDGCGAGAGVDCYFDWDGSLQEAAVELRNSVLFSKVNIDMLEETEVSKIKLTGSHQAVDSQFFSGMYERAFASYDLETYTAEDGRKQIHFDGLYTLLVSSEPSQDRTRYRDIDGEDGNGWRNIEWLNLQIMEVFQSELSQRVGTSVYCEMNVIF